jgi:hypothetical protein
MLLAATVEKLVPLILRILPTGPLKGSKKVNVGGSGTVKSDVLLALTPFTSTDIFPVVAPAGTATIRDVAEAVVTVAVMPLNLTILSAGVVEKLLPVMITLVFSLPSVGEKLVITGGLINVKSVLLVAVWLFTCTDIFPVEVPEGTVVVSEVAVAAVTVAVVPLNLTILLTVVVEKLLPVMVTVVPTVPLAGLKLLITGAGGGFSLSLH